MDYPSGYNCFLEAFARGIEPRRPMPVSEWADQNRWLSAKASSEPGRWQTSRIPYLRAIMDALNPRHPAPLVVFCKSSQVGGSETGLNWIGWSVHQAPGSFLALFPTEKVARKWVRTKLDPMIATSPVLRALFPRGQKKSAGNTLSEKHGPGFVVYTGSANIPDDVASISVPYLVLDEVDRMPIVLEDEGDPIELALRRLTTFPRSKAFMISTPTVAETSRIWPAWETSTQDRYFVPCTHCNHAQHLRWSQLNWIDGRPATAVYACEECGGTIEERHKPEMLADGEWRAAHPEREHEVKGFHVNGLYTPIGLGDSWAKHAAAWERSKGSAGRIQAFYNTRLGEVHKGDRRKVEWESLHARREPYKLRTIPRGVLLLTAGTDVQGNRLETQILGHGRGEQITVIDYVVHYGDTTRPEVWAELDTYLAGELVNEFGVRMRIECALVDAGFLPDTVLQFTRSREQRGIFASRGSAIAGRQPIGRPTRVDIRMWGELDRYGAERYEIGVSVLKHWLFERLRADSGTAEAPVLPADRHVRFSDELPDEYFKQLTAETFDPRKGWLARANYHRNESLDTFVLARAAAMHHRVAIHRFRNTDWDRLERMVQPSTAPDKSPELVFGTDPIPMLGGFLPTRAKVARS